MHQFWLLACVWNPTFPVAFRSLYNSGTEEIRSRIEFKLQFMHIKQWKDEISATFITCYSTGTGKCKASIVS